jgi:hypothetical protein
MYLVLEKNYSTNMATEAIRNAVVDANAFVWLEPPIPNGTINVLDVKNAKNLDENEKKVRIWAESVWESWSVHHETIRQWFQLGN